MGVKYVSIVFGQTYVNGALLTISSTSNNSICTSSKWLQKKLSDCKKNCAHPAPPPESASDYGVNLMHPHLFKKNPIKSMENNKSPGNDGLSKEFYEYFWNEIKNPF